jgi:hypothetical protein
MAEDQEGRRSQSGPDLAEDIRCCQIEILQAAFTDAFASSRQLKAENIELPQ